MKTVIFSATLAAIGFGAMAQDSPYYFPDFTTGTVVQKGGTKASANINYNTVTQEMVFMQGTAKQVLDPNSVDTVIIQNKKFVPGPKAFYLKITDTKIPLYEQVANNRSGGAATTSGAGAAPRTMTGTDDAQRGNMASSDYDLKLKQGATLEPDNHFWIEKDKQFYKANDKKEIMKVFPDKEQAIEAFVKENNIDFKKPEDLAKVVEFCNK